VILELIILYFDKTLVCVVYFDIITTSKQNNEREKIMKASQGIFKTNNTWTVLTFSKSWEYKTEKAAQKKWDQLVKADLV